MREDSQFAEKGILGIFGIFAETWESSELTVDSQRGRLAIAAIRGAKGTTLGAALSAGFGA